MVTAMRAPRPKRTLQPEPCRTPLLSVHTCHLVSASPGGLCWDLHLDGRVDHGAYEGQSGVSSLVTEGLT